MYIIQLGGLEPPTSCSTVCKCNLSKALGDKTSVRELRFHVHPIRTLRYSGLGGHILFPLFGIVGNLDRCSSRNWTTPK